MILHRDERCVAVNKPSGISTHRGWDDSDDALLQRVRDEVGLYVYPINRLDRGASGIVLFALDQDAARAFNAAWEGAEKHYYAITRGHPPTEPTLVDNPVPKRLDSDERVPAQTTVRCLETFGRYALVAAQPHTGKLHQIRRHLKHIACPLIGDVRYGKGEHNRLFRTQHDLHRLALHAHFLAVDHPDGSRLAVTCPLAPDLVAAIESAKRAVAPAPEA